MSQKRTSILGLLVLFLACIVALSPTLLNGWTNWDDQVYILGNNLITTLSWDHIVLMFTSIELNGAYTPIPELSWAVNYAIGGTDPFGYHLVNLLLHLANVSLVFLLFNSLTSNVRLSLIVALLFGIHPLHVEPVAWITGRKDLFYAFFFIISKIFWSEYLHSGRGRKKLYASCLTFFALSLFSKGVAVVLPIFLILIDIYQQRTDYVRMVVEKLPFFGLSLFFGLLAIHAQQQTVALDSLQQVPFGMSMLFACHAFVIYIVQVLVPFSIGAYHPYPDLTAGIPWQIQWSVLPVFIIMVALLILRRNRQIVFGMGILIIGLLPVIQLIPVGSAIVADRYTYIPYIGSFFLIASLFDRFLEKPSLSDRKISAAPLVSVFVVYVGWLGFISFKSSSIWKNSATLWTNAINQAPHSSMAYLNRGRYYAATGELELAKKDFDLGMQLSPISKVVCQELGLWYQRMGQFVEAENAFTTAIQLDSNYTPALLNRAINHVRTGQIDEAFTDLDRLERIDPYSLLLYLNRGVIYEQQLRLEDASAAYTKAIERHPIDPQGYHYRAVCYFRMNRFDDARRDAERWAELSPRNAMAYRWLARINLRLEDLDATLLNAEMAEHFGGGLDLDSAFFKRLHDTMPNY